MMADRATVSTALICVRASIIQTDRSLDSSRPASWCSVALVPGTPPRYRNGPTAGILWPSRGATASSRLLKPMLLHEPEVDQATILAGLRLVPMAGTNNSLGLKPCGANRLHP